MINMLRKKQFVLLMVYICFLLTITSTWVNNHLNLPGLLLQIFTFLEYFVFLLLVIFKLVYNIKNYRSVIKAPTDCAYYLFALYYILITGYRFLSGMEVKENLYYSIIFFGSVALYQLISSGRIEISKRELSNNLVWIVILFVVYRLMHCLVGGRYIEHQPVNVNLTTGVVAMLVPFVGNWLANECDTRRQTVLFWLALCGSIVVISISGSRAIFMLTLVNIAFLGVHAFRNKRGLLRTLSSVLAACLIVIFLLIADFGVVRYNFQRQVNSLTEFFVNTESQDQEKVPSAENDSAAKIDSAVVTDLAVEKGPAMVTNLAAKKAQVVGTDSAVDTKPGTEENRDSEATSNNEDKIQSQIDRSDSGRLLLLQYGMEQVRLNPWIGTGDVMYYTQVNEQYGVEQSSHNFIIEALVCYGVIGLIVIACLLFAILYEMKLFSKENKALWKQKILVIQTIVFFLALGLVQPTVFNMIMCPVFLLVLATCRKALLEQKNGNTV